MTQSAATTLEEGALTELLAGRGGDAAEDLEALGIGMPTIKKRLGKKASASNAATISEPAP